MKPVVLGAGLGFYGDSIAQVNRCAQNNRLDYLCSDHLGELTLSILQRDRRADPTSGYAKDMVALLLAAWPVTREAGTRFICNGGGLNPRGAAIALRQAMRARGFAARIAFVEGDDVLPHLDVLRRGGESLANTDTGANFSAVPQPFGFANAYLGARPLVQALQMGADIVVTGRVADASLFLAPLVHEFGWDWQDHDRLASGLAVGHLLECSGQVSGGNLSGDWWQLSDLSDIGYPIATVRSTGDAVIGKAPGSGGRVSVDSVRQQLLYEVHDPRAYLSPDVSLDMTSLRLRALGPDQVEVSGAIGGPPPGTLKVVAGYRAGYAVSGMLGYSWPDALRKAQAAADILRQTLAREEAGLEEVHISFPGFNALHGVLADPAQGRDLNECFMRVAVRTADKAQARRVAQHLPWMMVGGPPDVVYIPPSPPRELTAIWPMRIQRAPIESRISVEVLEP